MHLLSNNTSNCEILVIAKDYKCCDPVKKFARYEFT